MMQNILVALLTAGWCTSTFAQTPDESTPTKRWKRVARLQRDDVRELSGIVASRQYPGVFWAHGDSGSDPRLVALNLQGEVLAEVEIDGAPNTDWEDICADDKGHLFIGDIGNNAGLFPARYVYQVKEPDPRNPPEYPIAYERRFRYVYPDKNHFDSEALFWHEGSLYVVAKLRSPQAPIYRLKPDENDHCQLDKVIELPAYFVTGAEVSPNGHTLVLGGYTGMRVYPIEGDGLAIDPESGRRIEFPQREGYEACCFDGEDVVVASETGSLYLISRDDIERGTHFTLR